MVAHLSQYTALKLFGTSLTPIQKEEAPISWWQIDLRDPDHVHQMLAEIRPQRIFHLAGQAFVPASYDAPWDTLETNIKTQLNILESMRKLALDCRILVVSSAHVYGKIRESENPINENQPFRPDNPYSVSKISQDMLALQYFLTYQLHTVRARPFNHIGPGQDTRFALPNFAHQIAAAESGNAEPVIKVGNLAARRDFTDVRDVVRAYYIMLENGKAGEAYNVCSEEAHAMHELLTMMCAQSRVELQIEVDASRLRPLDIPLVIGDGAKLRTDTHWQPNIPIQQSLGDILQDARNRH